MATKTISKTSRNGGGVTRLTSERGMDYWVSRAIPLSVAPVSFTALAPGISLMHHLWGGDPTTTPFVTLGVFAGGAVSTGYTYLAAGKRKHLKFLGSATSAAVTTATTTGVVVGFESMWTPYTLGAIALSVLWGIRQGMKWGDDADGKAAGGSHALGRLGEVIDTEKFTFKRLKGTGKGVIEGQIEAEVGATIEEVQQMTPVIAAAARVPAGSATIRQDPDNAALGHFRLAVADLLKAGVGFNAFQGSGKSVCDAIDVGRYEHGDPVEITVTAHEDGGIEHLLLMGVTGAGKSAFARALITRLLTRKGVAVIGIDTAKGLQTFGPMVHGMAMVITDMPTARRFIKAMDGAIKARTDHLITEGLDYWTPKSTLTFLVIWAEEAADLMPSAEAYNKLLRAARSAGIWIVSSLQRATHDNLPTDARANHGAGMCMGVRDLADAQLALPDEVIEAGAVPTWKSRKKGYGYLTGLGTAEENWAVKMRGYDTRNKEDIAAAITAAAGIRTPLDEVTTKALGPVWEHRKIYTAPIGVDTPDPDDTAPDDPAEAIAGVDMQVAAICQGIIADLTAADPAQPRQAVFETALRKALRANPDVDAQALLETLNTLIEHANAAPAAQPTTRPTTPPATATAPTTDDTEDDMEPEMSATDRAEIDDARDDMDQALADAVDEHLTQHGLTDDQPEATLRTEIQDPEDISLDLRSTDPHGQVTAAEARRLFELQISQWLAEGKGTFAVKDLCVEGGFLDRIGRERTWFYRNFERFVQAGVIEAVEDAVGEYDILRDPTKESALT
ncbi:FtsK/SpoIIIE domain-containing protein [Actinomadura citrea]|uniref:FtsK/SpoIIIE domain-containing protein n=1 Tax=Actinomadura citrea TaxID=46158 RepID=UPI003CE4BB01